MSDTATIRLTDVVGSGLCVAVADGELVFEAIRRELDAGRQVVLSFSGVENLTSAFLNAAVGQLYGAYKGKEDMLSERMSVVDADDQDLETLLRTIERAKEYFRDPDRFSAAVREVMGDD